MLCPTALELLSRPCSSRYAARLYHQSSSASLHSPSPLTLNSFASECRAHTIPQRGLSSVSNESQQSETTTNLRSPVGYISDSNDPWFNLSYEDWLLRNTPHDEPTLFVYRNNPCVVLGRNQNPWKESTPKWLREKGIPLVRRRSGGGTVFHDLGNVNFSIILPRLLFTRHHGAELVARAVRNRLGIKECTVNDRNDVIIRLPDRDLKVSGSAYKIIQNRAYHHGTMLISSSLSELGQALRSSSPNMETKGIPSYRSPVTTLNAHLPSGTRLLTHLDFVSAVTDEFSSVYNNINGSPALIGDDVGRMKIVRVKEEDVIEEKVWKGVEELKSWEWTYGQTPEFTNVMMTELPGRGQVTARINSKKALITALSFDFEPLEDAGADQDVADVQESLNALALRLVGRRYESLKGPGVGADADDTQDEEISGINISDGGDGEGGISKEIVKWLRMEM